MYRLDDVSDCYVVMPSGKEKNNRTEGVPIAGILIELFKIQINFISIMRYNNAIRSARYANKEKPQLPLSIWVNNRGLACSGKTIDQNIATVTTLLCPVYTHVTPIFFR